MQFKTFKSGKMLATPEGVLRDACEQAAEFASSLPVDSLIGISHAFAQHNMAYATVWYRRHVSSSDTVHTEDTARSIDESNIEEWLGDSDVES